MTSLVANACRILKNWFEAQYHGSGEATLTVETVDATYIITIRKEARHG
jgi:hypothetical protein